MTKSKALVQTGQPSCLLSTWMTAPLSPQGMAAFLLICYVTTAGQHVALHTPVSILLKVEATEARLPWKWQKGFMDLIRFYNTHNRTGNLTLTLHQEIATYCSVMWRITFHQSGHTKQLSFAAYLYTFTTIWNQMFMNANTALNYWL